MIVHTIAPFKQAQNLPVTFEKQTNLKRLNKLEYASYLLTIPFKVGDKLVSNYVTDDKIYSTSIFTVDTIHEIHQLVEYETQVNGDYLPRSIYICNNKGTGLSTVPSRWRLCPEEILRKFNL